ncbi:hypothetical protein JXB02_06430 [Candidatus Woesearchaeota archaeon]|nr:hypothetical protein [Candidatus Woesearchaeota archaeon]
MQELVRLGRYDWALTVGFYAIYHCFLAICALHGYASRNQSCTVTLILSLIDEGKLGFEKDLVLRFDTLEDASETPTLRMSREQSTYGVASTVDTDRLDEVKGMVRQVQKATIEALS